VQKLGFYDLVFFEIEYNPSAKNFDPPQSIKMTKLRKKIFCISVWGRFAPLESYKLNDQKKVKLVDTLMYINVFYEIDSQRKQQLKNNLALQIL